MCTAVKVISILFLSAAQLHLGVADSPSHHGQAHTALHVVHSPNLSTPHHVVGHAPVIHAAAVHAPQPAKYTAPVKTVDHPVPEPNVVNLTNQNCRIEQVEEFAEVCTPTIVTKCEEVTVKTKKIGEKEFCVNIVKTVCEQTDKEEPNELCFYEYNKEEKDTEATTVEVTYEKKCEDQKQSSCPSSHGYGRSNYCKDEVREICYNTPMVESVDKTVTVGYPVASKTCVDKTIILPNVKCTDQKEERCFSLPVTDDSTQDLQKCTTELGPPKCERTPVMLPKQICVGIKYVPKPSYGAPEPAYGAPLPAYGAPLPTYGAPAAYGAPGPAYGAPGPAYVSPIASYAG